jgi:ADP-heptose:LPS heptosyltransferase
MSEVISRSKRILLFRTGHLGDAVVALPALWAIRKAFPASKITLLTNGIDQSGFLSARSVLPAEGLIDEFLDHPNRAGGGTSVSAAALLAKLIAKRFDTVFYLMPRVRTVKQIDRDERFFRLAGIKHLIGFDYARAKWLSTKCGTPSPVLERDADYLLNVVRSGGIGISHTDVCTDLLLSASEIENAQRLFDNLIAPYIEGRRLVGISPGSKWPSKIWPIERYIEVAKLLVENDRVFPVIVGGGDDRSAGESIIEACAIGANAAGVLSVRESAALLKQCRIFLGNDSGPMHLAAAVGTPCVAIFSAIDWDGAWYPFGQRNTIFRRNVVCEGCRVPDCYNDALCLKLIETADVYAACKAALNERFDEQ